MPTPPEVPPTTPASGGPAPTARQRFVVELAAGTALYSIVLGLFDDYTDVLHTSSYSVTFALAVVMHLLTAATFAAKRRFAATHERRGNRGGRATRALGVWFILFSSKFVFLWVIELLFPRDVQVSGFLALMGVILAFTLVDRLARLLYDRLGRPRA